MISLNNQITSLNDISPLGAFAFILKKQQIQAKTRKLNSTYSLDTIDSLKEIRVKKLFYTLQNEIQERIDREILNSVYSFSNGFNILREIKF